MKKTNEKITIDKKEYAVPTEIPETLEEILMNYSQEDVILFFSVGLTKKILHDFRKTKKPRKISLSEKRNLAFNRLTRDQLKELEGQPSKFEALIQKELIEVEKSIKAGEIL